MSDGTTNYDVAAVRAEFPWLDQTVNGRPLVYLDNAATSHSPQSVVDAWVRATTWDRANIHRGVHALSQRASEAYDAVRPKVARFLGAPSEREIVFVRGTTEAINLVAASFGARLGPGDAVVSTAMDHHANLVPWQMLATRTGAAHRTVPVTPAGELDLSQLERLLTPDVRLLAIPHTSNALGTVNPVREICALARSRGVPVLVDGAQAVPHGVVDVSDLGCDFFAFSGHKMYGPTGVGALWAKSPWLDTLPPYHGGGDMILDVRLDRTIFNEAPMKFEAGTPDIAGVIALGAAVDWMERVGRAAIAAHEQRLLRRAIERCQSEVPGFRLLGEPAHRAAVLPFVLATGHANDVGTLLDLRGVAVRTGHHCAQPLVEHFGVSASARASFAAYNTEAEVDAFVDALVRVQRMLEA